MAQALAACGNLCTACPRCLPRTRDKRAPRFSGTRSVTTMLLPPGRNGLYRLSPGKPLPLSGGRLCAAP